MFSLLVTDVYTAMAWSPAGLSLQQPCPCPSPWLALNTPEDWGPVEPLGGRAAPPLRSQCQPVEGWGPYASQKRPCLPFGLAFLLNLSSTYCQLVAFHVLCPRPFSSV